MDSHDWVIGVRESSPRPSLDTILRVIRRERHRGHGSQSRHNERRVTRPKTKEETERDLMWHEAFRDNERKETVAMYDYDALRVRRAEVLRQGNYVHPALIGLPLDDDL